MEADDAVSLLVCFGNQPQSELEAAMSHFKAPIHSVLFSLTSGGSDFQLAAGMFRCGQDHGDITIWVWLQLHNKSHISLQEGWL